MSAADSQFTEGLFQYIALSDVEAYQAGGWILCTPGLTGTKHEGKSVLMKAPVKPSKRQMG